MARRELSISVREMDGIILGEIGFKLLDVATLQGKVQLAQERATELPDECGGLVESCLRSVLFGQLGHVVEDVEVGHDFVHDAGMLHLDYDLLARMQASQMDLGDGSRG